MGMGSSIISREADLEVFRDNRKHELDAPQKMKKTQQHKESELLLELL